MWTHIDQLPDLASNVVHLWRLNLACAPEQLERCAALLSRDELERAERFHFSRDRDRFIYCRGVLRQLLGAYLARDSAALQFSYNAYGKPALAGLGAAELAFNVSHADCWALLAFTQGRTVGVDLERIRDNLDIDGIARGNFAASEIALLEQASGRERERIFFRLWTCKEAYIKAVGKGLSLPLDQFAITFAPDAVTTTPALPCAIRELIPSDGYVGAVASDGTAWELESFVWEG